VQKRKSVQMALDAGVTIVAGGDVGVFTHGENVRELELMVDYGMSPLEVLRSVTVGNAEVFGLDDRGRIQAGLLADIIVVEGRPDEAVGALWKIRKVIKGGKRMVGN
jgi:imidazolonepropionase-like amidohydrolase